MTHAVERLLASGRGDRPPEEFRLANAYCVALANTQDSYGTLLRGQGVNFPDGQPVALVLKASAGSASPQRVRGPSFFQTALQQSATDPSIRHFFVGSTDATLTKLIDEVKRRHPNLTIAGSYSPPFAPLSPTYMEDLLAHIRPAEPSIVWVGMGTPKQDFVSAAIVEHLGISSAGVGAAFDFVAGTVREAPLWVQRSGTEWIYRLVQEPQRLWKRYLIGNAQFVHYVVKHALLPERQAVEA
ncbi:WecB/TagA/CpsF family glycosyltransferase [Microbacterium sp. LWS13-1.2]|uniref:WecB/TagA/CpsF family glycosyltransferase n=1 Tax=Microbacterium sp. LWS13-1.2 TaxID=3135264 RepID=A0AAU6SFE0_9MICO